MFRKMGLALAVALASVGSAGGAMQPTPIMQVPATRPGKRGLFNDAVLPSSSYGRAHKPARISMAQQKRTSRKAKNVKRHRATSQG